MPQVLKRGSKSLNLENWKVFHPNGKHMFTCGETKAEWYLNNTGEDGNPLAIKVGKKEIRLTFEPKGYGYQDGDEFGLSGREIRCVVTGEEDGLQRHHIVPYCYRKYLPVEYKSKNHHDVVLVTHKVHEEYELEATKLKNQLADEYDVKSLSDINLDYTKILSSYSRDKVKMLSKLKSIFSSYGSIPQEVIRENLKFISEQTGIEYNFLISLTYIQLYKFYLLLKEHEEGKLQELKNEIKIKFDHGYHLVQKLDSHEKIENFVKRWRMHFVDTMEPKYMPKGWSIDYRCRVEI